MKVIDMMNLQQEDFEGLQVEQLAKIVELASCEIERRKNQRREELQKAMVENWVRLKMEFPDSVITIRIDNEKPADVKAGRVTIQPVFK